MDSEIFWILKIQEAQHVAKYTYKYLFLQQIVYVWLSGP